MLDQEKTKEQLLDELKVLRQELKASKDYFEKEIKERKLAEEKLKNSEETWKVLFDYAPDAFYLYDTTGTFIDGNIAAEKMAGYEKKELIGKSFFKLRLLSVSDLILGAKLLLKNVLGQSTGPDELVINRKDGSKVVAEISSHPVKVKDQTLVLGIARDITPRIRAAETIRESEKKLQGKIIELSMLSNATYTFLESDNTEKLFNYLGETLYQLSDADYMIMSQYNEISKSVGIKQLFGVKSILGTIIKKVGIDIYQIQVPAKDLSDQMDFSQRKKIYHVEGGLYSLSTQKVSKSICLTVEKILKIEEVFSIGLIWKGNYFGGITFCFKKGNHLKKHDLIESIVNQASLALSRKHTEESLINSEDSYRRFFNADLAGNYKTSPKGAILMCNQAFVNIIGCKTVERALQINLYDLHKDNSHRNEILTKLKEKGKLDLYESTLHGYLTVE